VVEQPIAMDRHEAGPDAPCDARRPVEERHRPTVAAQPPEPRRARQPSRSAPAKCLKKPPERAWHRPAVTARRPEPRQARQPPRPVSAKPVKEPPVTSPLTAGSAARDRRWQAIWRYRAWEGRQVPAGLPPLAHSDFRRDAAASARHCAAAAGRAAPPRSDAQRRRPDALPGAAATLSVSAQKRAVDRAATSAG
jgi:hypothetical protein